MESKRYISDFRTVVLEHVSHYRQAAGTQPGGGGFQIPPYYERVEVMTGGRGWIRADGNWREVLPGDIIWNKPGDFTIGRSDNENPYQCLAINLISKKKNGFGIPRFTHYPHLEEVKNFTQEIVSLAMKENTERSALRDYVLGRLLLWVSIYEQESDYRKLPLQLRQAMSWIENHFGTTCPLEEVAKAAGWSVAHLHEVFKQYLKQTPHQMIISHRIRAARERLVSTSQPIKQIAFECGFYDASALVHVFKTQVGLTPHAYRKRYAHLVM